MWCAGGKDIALRLMCQISIMETDFHGLCWYLGLYVHLPASSTSCYFFGISLTFSGTFWKWLRRRTSQSSEIINIYFLSSRVHECLRTMPLESPIFRFSIEQINNIEGLKYMCSSNQNIFWTQALHDKLCRQSCSPFRRDSSCPFLDLLASTLREITEL